MRCKRQKNFTMCCEVRRRASTGWMMNLIMKAAATPTPGHHHIAKSPHCEITTSRHHHIATATKDFAQHSMHSLQFKLLVRQY